jgi:signal transduction histidine kinase
MLMPTSSEFVAICRSQVAILTQALGASLCIVYLTEELVEGAEARLVPVVAYPETAQAAYENRLALPSSEINAMKRVPRLSSSDTLPHPEMQSSAFQWEPESGNSEKALIQQRQVILPLMHEGSVLGLLVTAREERSWDEWERSQIERVAETLALACVLDQRYQWLEHEQQQQHDLRSRQTDLMDNLLHQFRNPLTALKTFGKLLLKRLMPADNNREVAASIVRETDRLQELLQQFERVVDLIEVEINNEAKALPPASTSSQDVALELSPSPIPLLPASGLSNDTQLELKPCQISEILEPLLVSAKAIAQERGLELQASIPASLPAILANELALREVLSNLIDNALKYTPTYGKVLIQAGAQRSTAQGNQQAIAISDTGLGIPVQDLEHIFERHYRGIQAAGDIPGTGLGLAIAQELVQQMHGEIQVFSPNLLQPATASAETTLQRPGTTFAIWLSVVENPEE